MTFRLRALGLHLLASGMVLTVILGGMYLCWYRWPGWYLADAAQVTLMLAGVDLVAGPMLTFVIASASKPRRTLARDIAVIAVVQLSALAYGTVSLWNGRPLYYAFSEDVLQVVQAYDIEPAELALARQRKVALMPHWYSLPRWIWAPLPANQQEQEDHQFRHHGRQRRDCDAPLLSAVGIGFTGASHAAPEDRRHQVFQRRRENGAQAPSASGRAGRRPGEFDGDPRTRAPRAGGVRSGVAASQGDHPRRLTSCPASARRRGGCGPTGRRCAEAQQRRKACPKIPPSFYVWPPARPPLKLSSSDVCSGARGASGGGCCDAVVSDLHSGRMRS